MDKVEEFCLGRMRSFPGRTVESTLDILFIASFEIGRGKVWVANILVYPSTIYIHIYLLWVKQWRMQKPFIHLFKSFPSSLLSVIPSEHTQLKGCWHTFNSTHRSFMHSSFQFEMELKKNKKFSKHSSEHDI